MPRLIGSENASRLMAPLALAIALLSILLNIVLIMKLNQARAGALDALDRASTGLQGVSDYSFQHTVRINQAIPIRGELPLNLSENVAIRTTVPINTTVHTNVNVPLLGPTDLPVNIDTTFPVSLTVPVVISRTVPYSVTVPLDLAVPIEIRLRDVGGDALIQSARDQIREFRRSLQ